MIGTTVAYGTWLYARSSKTRPAMLAAQSLGWLFFYKCVVKQITRGQL